ncbi:MAG: ubiquinone biosynthesis regulatory protein kinase UbiB [Gammaproteobacteria bacterium RIFCSPHIGHO2_12_FULL_35_23]|nr:MAG: ubiquinone biosynthesis regulatory protein kinase UbiB [Gammaproteobacteria bacterium RIFCSPHIGHO2_12_FULL_35_23]
MKLIRVPIRLIYIAFILARFRIDELILYSSFFYPFRFISYFNPMYYISAKRLSRGQRLCCALETLGPIFIKFGQLLSARRDLLSADIADELSKLQDNVKPFSSALAKQIIEESLKGPLNQFFASFSDRALASASIAQVHSATLLSGEEVVVKVLRPKVRKKIQNDIEILKIVANLAHYFLPQGKHLRAKEVVEEFELSLYAELDLLREAANASLLRRNFLNSNKLYIPEVYWDYCKTNVMVMERIHGVPISDQEELVRQGTNLKLLAETGLEIFFTQVFEHNFFHADMHPGNFFVSRENKQQYIAVDFGIVGSLQDSDRRYIAKNLLAFFKGDYRQVALLHVESGWVDSNVRVDDFEAAIRTVSEPLFQKPLKDISMGQVILNLFKIARNFNFNIQPQLILLQKTLFHIESLARNLYPELDLWQTVRPYLERWLREQMGPKALFKKIKQSAPAWIEKLPQMPDLIYETLLSIKESNVNSIHIAVPKVKKHAAFYNIVLGLGFGLLIGAFLSVMPIRTFPAISWGLFGLGLVLVGASLIKKLFH